MKADTYREHLNDLQAEIEELRAKLKEAQTGDTISRQAAIDEITEYGDSAIVYISVGEIKRRLDQLPSAQPERKKGRWIYGECDGQDGWYCSECGGFVPWDYDYYGLDNIDFIKDFKTCPRCDARMISYTGMEEGEQDD